MLSNNDMLWLMEEPIDDPVDPLTIPEIRHELIHSPHDDELGLRLLVERPEELSMSCLDAA